LYYYYYYYDYMIHTKYFKLLLVVSVVNHVYTTTYLGKIIIFLFLENFLL